MCVGSVFNTGYSFVSLLLDDLCENNLCSNFKETVSIASNNIPIWPVKGCPRQYGPYTTLAIIYMYDE